MKLVYSANAKQNLTEITEFILKDKPTAARKWVSSIRASVNKLTTFPRLGRMVPEYSEETIREIIKGAYRIVYKIDWPNDTIVILAVHHSKRPLPQAIPDKS